MKNLILISLLVLAGCQHKGKGSETENWIQLFNGVDMNDWVIKMNGFELGENHNNTFRVEDSVLKVRYDQYDTFNNEFGHIFYKEKFSHYKLRVVYRVVGEQVKGGPGWAYKNNGAMLHCQSPESMETDQPYPVCIEAQLLGGSAEGERPTGNLCTPGTNVVMDGMLITRHCTESSSKTYRGEEWVTCEFVVLGDEIIHHIVEGDTVMTYSKPHVGGGNKPEDYPIPDGTRVTEGYIALQAESHPFDFKTVELLDLSK